MHIIGLEALDNNACVAVIELTELPRIFAVKFAMESAFYSSAKYAESWGSSTK